MTIDSALAFAAETLSDSGISEPVREARSLLSDAIGKDASFLYAHPEYSLTDRESETFRSFVTRRSDREPYQYIVGKQEFHGLDFVVDENVLIPRPETEAIVERSIGFLLGLASPLMCEIGVGSGCISVATLYHSPNAKGTGVDISAAALAVASRNAAEHGVTDRLQLLVSDVFDNVPAELEFDLIVANPPYVSLDEFEGLQPEVRDHEPSIALTDNGDGLSVIERIVQEAPRYVRSGGLLLVEIGFTQADSVLAFAQAGPWDEIEIIADLQGIPRTLSALRR